jgi:glycosyltransferase involved in cell wall biosynthesis
MTTPTVSIVTPTFNRAGTLPRLWRSLREQPVPFEWIVVDDASTDSTPSVVQSIGDPRIVFARQEDNRGQNAARNTGVRLSRGTFIVFLDSDDELAADALQDAVQAIKNAPATVGAVLMIAVRTFSKHPTGVLPDAAVLTEEDLVIKRRLRGDRAVIYKREVFQNQMLPEEYRACEHVFVLGISRWWNYLVVNRPLTLINREVPHQGSARAIVHRSALIAQAWEEVIANHARILRNNAPARVRLYMTVLYRYGVAAKWTSAWRVFRELRKYDRGCATAIKAMAVSLAGLLGSFGGEYWRLQCRQWRLTRGGGQR